jgi:hypothetical protein
MINVYIVFRPGLHGTENVYTVSQDLESAKKEASKLRDFYLAKGWDSWANRVKIRQPKDYNTANDLHNKLIGKGNDIDCFRHSKGYDAHAQDWYYEMASRLKKAMDQFNIESRKAS